MNRLLTALVVLVIALASSGAVRAQQGAGAGRGRGAGPLAGVARDQREQPAGTAVIRGRVLSADSGTPIRRAQVRATSGGGRAHITSTDSEGRFELRDLPAGRWEISASKAGYVSLRYGQRRPFEAGRPIELADAQTLERVDVSLPRGAAITGRVFDEFGDPVAGARVQVMRYQIVQGARRLTPSGGGDQSDDTGAFRLFGLMPGDYYVSATVRALPVDDPNDAMSYAPTYFPGTGNLAEAQRVTVSLSEEQSNINFSLSPVRTVRISGVALDSMGAPLNNGMLNLNSGDGNALPGMFGGGTRVRADGSFTMVNVAPGSYTLTAVGGMRGGGRGGGGGAVAGGGDPDIELASMPLFVGSEDLTGLTIVTGRGATLSGVVTSQGGAARPPANGIQVETQSNGGERAFARPARVAADGTFRLVGLQGSRVIRVTGLPQTWMVRAVMVGGVDVIDTPVEFRSGQDIKDAEIVLTDRVTEVSGSIAGVASAGGTAVSDYTVVVFPDDDAKWTAPSRYIRSARPDQQGLFKIRALPPNARYLAVAVDYLEDGEANDPEFLEAMKNRATTFAIGEGESKAIALRLLTR